MQELKSKVWFRCFTKSADKNSDFNQSLAKFYLIEKQSLKFVYRQIGIGTPFIRLTIQHSNCLYLCMTVKILKSFSYSSGKR